jgi:uncharacterized protein (TIGR03437 family)
MVGTVYSQQLKATGGTLPYVNWTVAAGSLPAGLTLSATGGTIAGTPTASGTSNFTVTVKDSAGSTSQPQAFSIIIASAPDGPVITAGGIVSAAGLQTSIRSGSWATIYGSMLASTTQVNYAVPLTTTFQGVSISVAGQPAFISAISPGQINIQVPDGIPTGQVPVTVTNGLGTSTSVMATVSNYAPAFFVGAVLNSRYYVAATESVAGGIAYIGPSGTPGQRPANPGETLTLWGTGFGPTTPTVPAGSAFAGAAPMNDPVQIMIDNIAVTPSFAGISGAGLYQFNIVVPNLPPGDHTLTATVAGVNATPTGIWLATQ